ncbi:unnamed protein product [Symbiodinium necroappetens]|uniref:Sugar phosphate transporter domain-containing protein n=1 Tax=Symbiodinium necroappetens TaxID=1628268 RepID=A0A812PDW2_9DINO|nr:unnamed protein product [Symbiodinium necroappetens]
MVTRDNGLAWFSWPTSCDDSAFTAWSPLPLRLIADGDSAMELDVGQVAAVLVATFIFLAIWAILQPRGLATQICTCCFVLSLVCTQLLMKDLGSGDLNFRYPATVTSLHFIFMWLTSWTFWASRKQFHRCRPSSVGSLRRYAKFVLPIALSLPLSIALNNTSLLYMGAGLAGIIGTMAPIITAVLTHCLGRRINKTGWIGVSVATFGATCIGAGELKDQGGQVNSVALGLVFCTASVFLRAAKAVLQDQLLEPTAYEKEAEGVQVDLEGQVGQVRSPGSPSPKREDKEALPVSPPSALSPMHVWALQAPPCTAWAVVYALLTESPNQAVAHATPSVARMIFLTCITATFLNVLGMTTMKQLGASSMQIIGKLNTIILLAFSMGFWGERMPQEVLVGTCFVLAGVAVFEQRGPLATLPGWQTALMAEEQLQAVSCGCGAQAAGCFSKWKGNASPRLGFDTRQPAALQLCVQLALNMYFDDPRDEKSW